MYLVPAKCPECGGNINIDPDQRLGVCEYCKQPFVVQEAIQNFNTTYNITNNNEIKADVVNVYKNEASDFVVKAGELMEYNGSSVDVVIPEGVIAIHEDAFKNKKIKSIVIPKGITEIRPESFCGCTCLQYVSIPEGVTTIGDRAFYRCLNIKSIEFPNSLAFIGSWAFSGCQKIKSIIIPYNVVNIDSYAFNDCSALTSVIFENKNNIKIAEGVFSGVPNDGGDDAKSIIHRQRLEKKERLKQELISRFEKRYKLGENITEHRCPFCSTNLNRKGVCKNRYCLSYKKTPQSYIEEFKENIENEICPFCKEKLTIVDKIEHTILVRCTEGGYMKHCCELMDKLSSYWF